MFILPITQRITSEKNRAGIATYITLMTLKNENKNGTVPITCGMTGTFTLYK